MLKNSFKQSDCNPCRSLRIHALRIEALTCVIVFWPKRKRHFLYLGGDKNRLWTSGYLGVNPRNWGIGVCLFLVPLLPDRSKSKERKEGQRGQRSAFAGRPPGRRAGTLDSSL